MATIYLSTGSQDLSIGGDRPRLQSCVSIVVDDVDGDVDGANIISIYPEASEQSIHQPTFLSNSQGPDGTENEVFDDNTDARSDVSHGSKSSRGSTSREENENRLQQIKDEVQHRRDEFSRLLDEHEQVIRELRRIESSGELQTLTDMASGRAEEACPGYNMEKQEE